MAMEDLEDLDLGEEEPKTSKKKILLFAIVGLVLLIAMGAALYFLGVFSSADEEGEGQEAEEQQAQHEPPPEAIYYKIEPAFVVNFHSKAARLLQVTVEVMARDPDYINALKKHTPIIKNNLLMLFAGQDPAALRNRAGKERLRAQALAEVQKVLKEQTGEPGVEAVYFTSFVMQ